MEKTKSFWERPEGTTGMLFAVGIAIVAGWLIVSNIAWILTAITNVLYLGIMCVALAALGYVVLDKKMRTLVWYMYRMAMRWITGIVIVIDPVAIVKTHLEEMRTNRERMNEQMNNVNGEVKKLDRIISDNKDTLKKSLAGAKKAKEMGKSHMAGLKVRSAGKIQESNIRLDELRGKLDKLLKSLRRLYDVTGVIIEETETQVDIQIRERNAMRSGHSAMKAAQRILKGGEEQELYDLAMEHMADDVAMKAGEIEMFMNMSETIMDGIDMDHAIFEEEGMKLLEEWEKNGDSALFAKMDKPITKPSNATTYTTANKSTGGYDDLL